ncbi:MAG: universal stress protein [Qingshengfaniella sp.]
MTGIVLCALDTSEPDHEEPVLRRAAEIADLDGARLDVLTVVPSYGNAMVGSYFGPDFHAKVMSDAKGALVKFCEQVLGAGRNASIRHLVDTGSIYERILHAARVDKATVIVIGSHRPDLSDYLLGPNAARVVRHAGCSVFVVR